uniref:Uncharacterized protein n=1 Tax=Fagus sylvatica TaxID=28930 RepID=A0A2N9FXF8_FAGSY
MGARQPQASIPCGRVHLVAFSSSSMSSPRRPLPLALKGPIPPFFSPSSMGRPWNQVIVLCVFDEL